MTSGSGREERSVAGSDANPYAPPTVAEVAAKQSPGWSVDRAQLVIRDGTWLPEVDLTASGDGTPLVPVMISARANPLRQWMVILALGMVVAYSGMAFGDWPVWLVFLVIFVFIRLCGIAQAGRVRLVNVVVHDSLGTLRTRYRHQRIRALAVWLGLGLLAWGLYAEPGHTATRGRAFWLALIIINGSQAWPLLSKQWRLAQVAADSVTLRGVAAPALSMLSHPPVAGEPRRVKYRVHHLAKAPFRHLVWARRFQPLACLTLALLKWRDSPALSIRVFSRSEAREFPPDQADAELRKWWVELSAPGGPMAGWSAEAASRLDSPQGSFRLEDMAVLSPDRTILGTLAISRSATVAQLLESRFVALRSWLADGTVVETSSLPGDGLQVPGLRFQEKISNDPARVLAAHQRALPENPAVLAGDGWRTRMEELGHARQVAGEAAGRFGPEEEMDFIGPARWNS